MTHPEIDDANLKGTLWTFEQWPALKMQVRYGISILPLLTFSHKVLSGYDIIWFDIIYTILVFNGLQLSILKVTCLYYETFKGCIIKLRYILGLIVKLHTNRDIR